MITSIRYTHMQTYTDIDYAQYLSGLGQDSKIDIVVEFSLLFFIRLKCFKQSYSIHLIELHYEWR